MQAGRGGGGHSVWRRWGVELVQEKMRDKNENFVRKVCKKKKRKKMKIYINHSFLFNIDSMLRWFSSEIDHRCGQNVVSTNNCSCCSLYVWFILYIVLVLWESYLTKQLQKKKLHMGCSWVCHSGRGERKVDIYIYTEGGGHYILCKRIIQINVQKTIISALGMTISFLG